MDPVVVNAGAGADDEWLVDYARALQRAKQEGKHLFLDFTGSDWCQPCVVFKGTVLSDPDFFEQMKKLFIFVELDFPRMTKLDENLQRQNYYLKEHYEVEGFPTVVLANAEGEKYGQLQFSSQTADEFLSQVTNIYAAKKAADTLIAQFPKQISYSAKLFKLGSISLLINTVVMLDVIALELLSTTPKYLLYLNLAPNLFS